MQDNQPSENEKNVISPLETWRSFVRIFLATGKGLITAPARWGMKGWIAFLLIVLSAALAYIDKWRIRCLFAGDDSGVPEFIADIGKHFGDGELVAGIVILLLVLGLVAKRRLLVEAGVVLAVAGLFCGLVTTLGQFVLAEARPERGGEMAFFILGGHGISGHASSAALLFWPLYSVLGQNLKKIGHFVLGAILMGWVVMVAWSRMWDDKHFLWNVILGMSVGFSMGYLAVKEWKHTKEAL